jgi:hypothetical protein
MRENEMWTKTAVLTGIALGLAAGCGDAGPQPDTTRYGYVSVWESGLVGSPTGPRRQFVILSNGADEIRLEITEKTRFDNPLILPNGAPAWSFEDVYRVDGKLNWTPPDATSGVETVIGDISDTLWAIRIVRLEQADAEALITAGEVTPRN